MGKGWQKQSIAQTFAVDLADGELNIDIQSIKEKGKISAIKIVRP